jgi:hypothetical protein
LTGRSHTTAYHDLSQFVANVDAVASQFCQWQGRPGITPAEPPFGTGDGAMMSGFKRAPIRSFGRVMISARGAAVT